MNALSWKSTATRNPKIWRSICGYIILILEVTAVFAFALAPDNMVSPSSAVHLTVEEHAWLSTHPEKLTLFFNTEFPPIEFISESGIFTGIGADIISRIEELLDVDFIKTPMDDWNKHLAALKSGECAIAPTIVRTNEREKYAFFTIPYATVPVVIITTRATLEKLTLDDLAGRRVGVVSGYATETYLQEWALQEHFDLITVANVAEGLQRTAFGQIDAFVENLAVAAYYIELEGIPNLRVAGTTDYAFAWCIGVSREYPLLFSAISKALEHIPASEMADIRKHWITMEVDFKMNPKTRRNLILTAIFAFLLLAGLTGVSIILKHRLNQKVAGLKENEAKFRLIFESFEDLYFETDVNGIITLLSPSVFSLSGWQPEELIGCHVTMVCEDLDRENFMNVLVQTGSVKDYELTLKKRDGSKAIASLSGHIIYNSHRAPGGTAGLLRDITARKIAEAEKEKLQARLSQAQKMEAIGSLAGGIAHDFNNMLTVILGYAQSGLNAVDASHPLHYKFQQISNAASRSADITRQLLAFARKQTISPKILDLNLTLEGMLNILRRLIGEDIDLSWKPAPDLWPVKMDPSQIDQVLANLCVNARDAIAGVGKLTIETGMVCLDQSYCDTHVGFIPGSFVLLAVSDSGCGMDKEILGNLFKPFFTTKDVGKGTGLGLATVYGIVKQNNGFINVYSEPGQGTTFKIYLPRYRHKEETPAVKPAIETPLHGFETILLVEDEPMILEMTTEMLETQGYTVLGADRPGEAIRMADAHTGDIHLLMTDVVLPEMNGRVLAEKMSALYPDLKLLFMSGYTANVIAHQGVLDEGVAFIQKPFSIKDLTEKVRGVLDVVSDKS